jgi:hypothetical protein
MLRIHFLALGVNFAKRYVSLAGLPDTNLLPKSDFTPAVQQGRTRNQSDGRVAGLPAVSSIPCLNNGYR